jgi:hypothetical protein
VDPDPHVSGQRQGIRLPVNDYSGITFVYSPDSATESNMIEINRVCQQMQLSVWRSSLPCGQSPAWKVSVSGQLVTKVFTLGFAERHAGMVLGILPLRDATSAIDCMQVVCRMQCEPLQFGRPFLSADIKEGHALCACLWKRWMPPKYNRGATVLDSNVLLASR